MKLDKYYKLFESELFDSCIPFWLNNAIDEENGGVLNCLDRFGKVYSTDKSVWMQGRAGWMFSYIYNHLDKNEKYLKVAKSCLEFLDKNCIDKDGRMYFTVTKDGKPLRKRRYWFSETFYILANAEYYIATGDTERLETAKKYFDFVYGMYLDGSSDPYKITPKSYSSTRSLKGLSQPMIMLNVASVMKLADKENVSKYNEFIDVFISDIKTHYNENHKALLENVGVDGSFDFSYSDARIVNPGHDIECSWFLLETALERKDDELVKFASTIFKNAIEFGWDKKYGGILYFRDVLGNPVEAYEHDMKLWWPHNEAVIGSLMFYLTTKDEYYFNWFKKVVKYAFAHFSDKKNGEWFGYLRRDGKPTEPPCKGHTYKGPFHVMRMLAKCMDMLNNQN